MLLLVAARGHCVTLLSASTLLEDSKVPWRLLSDAMNLTMDKAFVRIGEFCWGEDEYSFR